MLKAVEELGVKKEETVFVGDSRQDMESGRAAGVTVDHADLIGAPQADQADRAHDVCGDVALVLFTRRERRHVATGVGDEQDLVVLLVDETFDENASRPCGGLPVDVADIVAANVGPQVVELQAAAVQ